MPTDTLRVFISSTSEDLRDHREVARDAVLDMKWQPVMMEHFGPSPDRTVEACAGEVRACDLVVLLVAMRRGWVPSIEQGGDAVQSITALELGHARAKGIDVLPFLAGEKQWPGSLWEETDEGRAWIKSFRAKLNQPAGFFDPEPDGPSGATDRLPRFHAKIQQALVAHKIRLIERHRLVTGGTSSVDDFGRAREALIDAGSALFLGTAVHTDGPLSAAALAAELRQGNVDAETSVVTAAEYAERVKGGRQGFLERLTAVLEKQQERAVPPVLFDLVARTLSRVRAADPKRRLPLIVSSSWDLELERSLDALKPTIVTHIARSDDDRSREGKILVLRHDGSYEICLADKVSVPKESCVVYKPLGSPMLNRRIQEIDPDLDIDTVVATESDHLTFLGRLENQHTQIPTRFTRSLQQQALLFLGYPLDVWNYRLVAQVFQSAGRLGSNSILAVRKAASQLEELAWRRLGAAVVPMESDEFSRRIVASAGAP